MRSVKEIRRENLQFLVEKYGSMKKLNEALGRKDNSLTQILNESVHSVYGYKRTMGDKLARSIEEKLCLGYGWLDADHSNEAFPEEVDLIYLRKLNVEASCGSGIQNYEDEAFVDTLSVSRQWFEENIDKVRKNGYEIITASGDSMEPTLKNGDLVVIDRLDTAITKRDGVFCVLIDNDLYLKRVQKMPGVLRFISDNRLYDPFEIKLGEIESRVVVFGRMVNSLNLKKYE